MGTLTEDPKVRKTEGICSCGTCLDEMKQARQRVEKTVDDVKAAVSGKFEDGKTAAERLIKHGRYAVEDRIEEAAHNIKRHPFGSLSLAFVAGAAVGFIVPRLGRK